MRKILAILAILFTSCNNQEPYYPPAENALDAGREFIDACLKGDFSKAASYTLPGEQHAAYLKNTEAQYRTLDKEGRQQLRQASINIREINDVNENTSIIHYSNSFDKIPHTIKAVRQNGKWLVDLTYTNHSTP